jgi:GNAT superfamily N-acetyltransferase
MKLQDAVVTSVLADGTGVDFRPVGPDDKPLLEQGMTLLSPASRRLRFMTSIENLSRSQLAYLTEIDHESHLAWGAMVEGRPVAVGRLVRLPDLPATAEIALTVVDDWQGRGIGQLLVRLLAEIARSIGIERFLFEALPENERIVRLFQRFGATHELGDGVVSGSFEIGSIEPLSLEGGDLLQLATAARSFGSSRPAAV